MPNINSASKNRALNLEEVKRLVASNSNKAKEQDKQIAAAARWPDNYNLRLLAEAVRDSKEFVIFEPHKRFRIKYDTRSKSVFIKPDGEDFAPCGWFSYERLEEFMVNDE